MSFGCYVPDVHTTRGCRITTSSLSLDRQRQMSEKINRETRNPITGELMTYSAKNRVDYSQQKSNVYDREAGGFLQQERRAKGTTNINFL